MRKTLRWIGYGLATILVLALLFAAWVWFASSRALSETHDPRPERLVRPTPAQLAAAPRMARVLGCFGCHGEGLAGRLMFDVPGVATVWASNLTEIAARASDQQLAQGIRQGIGHDGRGLWIMPSPQYSRLADGEVAALIAVIRAQPRVGGPVPGVKLGPLARFGAATGSFRSVRSMMEDFRVRQPYDLGPRHEAGRHLAATACAECHGPDLAGGQAGNGDMAPGLSIAAAYDLDQFRTLMRTGRAPHGRDLGLMAEVSRGNSSHLEDAEIERLHLYLVERAARVQDPPRE